MQLFICYSNHIKFLHNIHKNFLDFFAFSLFSHTSLFTLAFHIIILLLFFSFLVQLFIFNSNYIKISQKIHNPFFNSFAYLLFSHTHEFTLAFHTNLFLFISIVILCNHWSVIQIISNFYIIFINFFSTFLLISFFLTLTHSLSHFIYLFFIFYNLIVLCNS